MAQKRKPAPAGGPEAAAEKPEESTAARLKRAFERAQAIEGQVDQIISHAAGLAADELDPAEATAYVARRILLSRVVEAAALLSHDKMEKLEPAELTRFIMHLESSRLAGDRLRIRYEKLYAQAREDVIAELERAVADRPDLLAALRRLPPIKEARKNEKNMKNDEEISSCGPPPAVVSN